MTSTMPGTLDIADALRALGLPDDPNVPLPDALTLRKAYVRVIKRYRPEANPDEFQRVRAAYEFLEQRRSWPAFAACEASQDVDDVVEGSDRDLPDAPPPAPPDRSLVEAATPEAKVPDLPPWHATVDELTTILTEAGVMDDGVKPQHSISAESRDRLRPLLWRGWPEELDAPLVRLTARLFELGHEYDGHLLLEWLEAAPNHVRPGRGAYSDWFHTRLAGVARAVNAGDGRPDLDWIFIADDAAAPPRGDADVPPMSPRVKQLLTVLLCVLVSVVVKVIERSPHGATRPGLDLSSWIEDTCSRYSTACADAADFAAVLEGGHCGRIAPELASFGAILSQKLTAIDASAVTRRAHDAARTLCPTELPPASPPKEASR